MLQNIQRADLLFRRYDEKLDKNQQNNKPCLYYK